jgi:hypothetical protein
VGLKGMARLIHEVWVEVVDGMTLESCCLAGPRGNDQRALLAPGARLIATFEAGCHYEAMTTYHRLLGREVYTTKHAWDHEPYPEEWLAEQQSG